MTKIPSFLAGRLAAGMFGVLILLLAAFGAAPAQAGVAIENTVVLDPYDPVPSIQFGHWYNGYGSGCYDRCGRTRCGDGCHRRTRHHCERDCDRGCGRDCTRETRDCGRDCYRDRCDRDDCRKDRCDHDGCRDRCDGDRCHDRCDGDGCGTRASNCTGPNCYDVERYEHRWRDGDRIGQEWYDRGRRERETSGERRGRDKWYDGDKGNDQHWRDYDDPPPDPPPAPPAPPPDKDKHRRH